jgi:ATP-dependent helicase/nuclease subunit B
VNLTILLVPSRAAALEVPRRLVAATGRALAGLMPMKLSDLAEAVAEPVLLGRGLRPWHSGHGALIARRLLEAGPRGVLPDHLPSAPVARVLARSFAELRGAGIAATSIAALATRVDALEDSRRLAWLAELYTSFGEAVAGHFADPSTLLEAATEAVAQCAWLRQAEVLILDDLETTPLEQSFLAALARLRPTRRLAHPSPPSLKTASFAAWAERQAITVVDPADTLLSPLFPAGGSADIARLRRTLFDPPPASAGEALPAADGSVELLTAPGEAAEVRTIVRRILREAARGVPFEEMGVILPRPEEYARLFTDLLSRLDIPHRLHPSLPLRFGRIARSLLLLLRCRGLRRAEVMEFLTFAPIPFAARLGPDVIPRVSQWDLLSREAGIVSDLERWRAGTNALAAEEDAAAAIDPDAERRERRQRKAEDARILLHLVDALDATLADLAGDASWAEWSQRLTRALDSWIGAAPGEATEREAVRTVLLELASLGFATPGARWDEVEAVLESRFEWERLPHEPLATGGVHVGAIDALAGVPFRWLAIVGLVEGGYPGVLRPDPLLLDAERELLAPPWPPVAGGPQAARRGQLSLFDDIDLPSAEIVAAATPGVRLPTTQDRLLETRRQFGRAVGQAIERLVLSYPRADSRSGRERLPSLFFVAAASAAGGASLSTQALAERVHEDVVEELPLAETLDASERDRVRVRVGGRDAVVAIAAGSTFFKQSHLAAHARWSKSFTAYEGLVAGAPVTPEIAALLDPVTAPRPISASALATFAQCGFKYLLQYVLRLDPVPEPEERTRLDPLERGTLFHAVAEGFLRERRDRGLLPIRNTPEERGRLREIAEERLEAFILGTPPRFTLLWDRERGNFHQRLLVWLAREARTSDSVPLHFEVGFGLRTPSTTGEPHLREPLSLDLGDGRALRVSGKIDRVDRRSGEGLVVRDYKTGRTPTQPGVFRGGRQLQVPFYILAVRALFPEERVVHAFLDYVDDGQRIAFDPDQVTGEAFRTTLNAVLAAIAQGNFVQEPSACEWCDFKKVCGPSALIERRRSFKIGDRRVQQFLRLKDLA